MGGAQRDYREERMRALRAVHGQDETPVDAGVDRQDCALRLRELIELGEALVAMLDAARDDPDLGRLRRWLSADLEHQRALLESLRDGQSTMPRRH